MQLQSQGRRRTLHHLESSWSVPLPLLGFPSSPQAASKTLGFVPFPCGPLTSSHNLHGERTFCLFSRVPSIPGWPSNLSFPHRDLWPARPSTYFNLFSVPLKSTFVKPTSYHIYSNAYKNLYWKALKASLLCSQTKLPRAERQQRGQSLLRLSWAPAHHGLTENVKPTRTDWAVGALTPELEHRIMTSQLPLQRG